MSSTSIHKSPFAVAPAGGAISPTKNVLGGAEASVGINVSPPPPPPEP